MEKAPKPYKNWVFKVVIQKCEKQKKWIFSKNCLTLFVSGREKKTPIFVHTICFGQFFLTKTVQTRKNYKNSGFSEISQNQKWHLFFEKGVFWHGWKSGFYLLCFWKAVLCWKHYFYCVFSKTQLFKSKTVGMLKKTENLWRIVGCFWTWQNGVFWVCFFWGCWCYCGLFLVYLA